jgi:hypothetical protein
MRGGSSGAARLGAGAAGLVRADPEAGESTAQEADRSASVKLKPIPLTLREANDFVSSYHRHSQRTQRDGGKFAIGVTDGASMWGVAIVGRPMARLLDDGWTAEVTRTCVAPGAPKGACSFLYGRFWRIWQQMGGLRMVTYTLATESGASLRGVGWRVAGESKPSAGWDREHRQRSWQPVYGQMKFRWEVTA